MGNVKDGLGYLLNLLVTHLTQKDGSYDGEGKIDYKTADVKDKGVSDRQSELSCGKGFLEMFKAHPVACDDPLKDVVLFECHNGSQHGYILKEQDVYHGNDEHYVERNVPLYS